MKNEKNYTIFTALQPKEAVAKGPHCTVAFLGWTELKHILAQAFFAFLYSSWKTTPSYKKLLKKASQKAN